MTDRADINSVLSEIRSMRSQMMQSQRITQEQTQRLDKVADPRQPVGAPSFNDMFSQAVNNVNALQKDSNQLATAYEQGDPSVDITRVMIAAQKSSVSFEALTQVRNRVVRAYEDIMNMPV
ncbi:flagellar hook-basal body complex protein FliE [Hydrocarboniclastica marina]|uniref:Flagellar hook-basal body complex protein FliE n=1 Tax=Hydrocarboniclastica marina TaxID=2259620 RepID=A0A4V1D8M1_9ALTE|nr:flagellar hook-basal body complex protein FliE [Hydrocarboniclastica marina]MAL98582.1 flagellar hook-basal body complex protein FliE [Alteromonadaceae bacterium]QCF25670.1 flagellar hook-basal body complex protein FliE [Hydrocarboniclastica marina]